MPFNDEVNEDTLPDLMNKLVRILELHAEQLDFLTRTVDKLMVRMSMAESEVDRHSLFHNMLGDTLDP